MNKQAFLEETYNSAFEDELEKISGVLEEMNYDISGSGGLKKRLKKMKLGVSAEQNIENMYPKAKMKSWPYTGQAIGGGIGGGLGVGYSLLKHGPSSKFKKLFLPMLLGQLAGQIPGAIIGSKIKRKSSK